ncbi:MAG TPA: phosphoribosylaminoimidazolesuccinocarboxamide synthase [Dehalococcoidia bacterium]
MSVLLETNLPNRFARGKVRDTYDLGDRLLMVATDRISAFDVVMRDGIPHKGAVLTQLSAFWFEATREVVPNHFIRLITGPDNPDVPFPVPEEFTGRAMLVHKARRIDAECIVRGYLAGSAWAEYRETGTAYGIKLPPGLRESDELPSPIFTPTTKAETGHDEPLTWEQFVDLVGPQPAEVMKVRSLALYQYAAGYARERGIIIADTKFEFGELGDEIIVIDEVLTPDSSRFWPADQYQPGRGQPSFDKQYLRDWLAESGWNREPPPPDLPAEVVRVTSEKYLEAFRRITGREPVLPPQG